MSLLICIGFGGNDVTHVLKLGLVVYIWFLYRYLFNLKCGSLGECATFASMGRIRL